MIAEYPGWEMLRLRNGTEVSIVRIDKDLRTLVVEVQKSVGIEHWGVGTKHHLELGIRFLRGELALEHPRRAKGITWGREFDVVGKAERKESE